MNAPRRQLLIVGAGGYGREVLSYIEDDNPLFDFKGFLDSRADALAGTPRTPGIVGDPMHYQPQADEVFMVALGDPRLREHYSSVLREQHQVDFATVVHPRANVNRHARLGRGCIISPGAGISVDVQIGDFSCVQEFTVIGHDAQIGPWVQINSHCTIGGGARIGAYAVIHPNCVISSRAVIGEGAVVAPGSVVVGRIPAGITVLGNPARRFEFK